MMDRIAATTHRLGYLLILSLSAIFTMPVNMADSVHIGRSTATPPRPGRTPLPRPIGACIIALLHALPWLLLLASLAYLACREMRWAPSPHIGTATSWGQRETAWHPYVEVDGPGRWSACVSSVSGQIMPDFILPDATPTINQAL